MHVKYTAKEQFLAFELAVAASGFSSINTIMKNKPGKYSKRVANLAGRLLKEARKQILLTAQVS